MSKLEKMLEDFTPKKNAQVLQKEQVKKNLREALQEELEQDENGASMTSKTPMSKTATSTKGRFGEQEGMSGEDRDGDEHIEFDIETDEDGDEDEVMTFDSEGEGEGEDEFESDDDGDEDEDYETEEEEEDEDDDDEFDMEEGDLSLTVSHEDEEMEENVIDARNMTETELKEAWLNSPKNTKFIVLKENRYDSMGDFRDTDFGEDEIDLRDVENMRFPSIDDEFEDEDEGDDFQSNYRNGGSEFEEGYEAEGMDGYTEGSDKSLDDLLDEMINEVEPREMDETSRNYGTMRKQILTRQSDRKTNFPRPAIQEQEIKNLKKENAELKKEKKRLSEGMADLWSEILKISRTTTQQAALNAIFMEHTMTQSRRQEIFEQISKAKNRKEVESMYKKINEKLLAESETMLNQTQDSLDALTQKLNENKQLSNTTSATSKNTEYRHLVKEGVAYSEKESKIDRVKELIGYSAKK